ncbi:hypothetical protein [Roseisolibacter agri]|uniref:Uncharacterized protein n=1 Tax=Roseisolibacter agri TaxID=2014610 RepID=A0AA37PZB9_9BACT|nr:hypothetical protein [Roseisolibacter agri]GLC23524.1 hypothetical protein rosag_00370 [Roseisolibacter agri]
MRSRSNRTTVWSVVWALLLGGGILAHRAGMLPSWVYQGRLRDEVKRRTGVDLADRSTPRPILEVTNVHGSGGRYPTITFDVRNATDSTLRHVDMWARFHLAMKDAGYTPTVRVVTRDSVLRAGATRRVTLRAEHAQGLGVTTRGPLLTADLYWSFSDIAPHRRGRQTPRLAMLRVE